MYVEITDIEVLKQAHGRSVPPGLTWTARAWANQADYDAGQPFEWENNWVCPGQQCTGRRIITNDEGWLLAQSGDWVDPDTLVEGEPEPEWQREDFAIDVRQMILDAIVAYGRRRETAQAEGTPYPRNHVDPGITTGAPDARGLLQAGVMALRRTRRTMELA